MTMATCVIEGCNRSQKGFGYCNAHYKRFMRHGDPTAGRRTPGQSHSLITAAAASETDVCIEWTMAKSRGYGFTTLPDGTTTNAHRLVCRLAHGEPASPLMQAAHSCGNRGCINPRHLRWATQAQNEADKVAHGTVRRGEASPNARLCEDDIRQIRIMRRNGYTLRAIADRFQVTSGHINQIAKGALWSHVNQSHQEPKA